MALFLQFVQDSCDHPTPVRVSSLSLLAVINLIFIPFSIYITYKYYRIRYVQGLVHRYPHTVVALSILNMLYLFIVTNYMLILNGIVLEYANSNSWILFAGPIVYEPWFLLIIVISIARLWLISFNINLNVRQTRQKWQSLLIEGNV